MILNKIPLSEVAEVFNGKTPSKDEQRNFGYPVLKIKDISEDSRFKGKFDSFVDNELADKFTQKKIRLNDSLILNAAHNSDYVGSKQYCAESKVVDALPTGEWLVVRAKEDKLDSKFLNYWLGSSDAKFQIKQMVKGIHLYPKDVARLEISLSTLDEQKRIAAILDKADVIRRKRLDAIKLADEFLRAVFLDMFGDPIKNSKSWPTQPLDQVAPSSPSRGVAASKNDQVWLLNLDNIESNTGRILAEYKCSYGEVGSSTHWFDQSHVLYSKLRPYLNKVVLPHTSGIATSELLPLKPNPAVISREYLAFLLRSNPFLHWANNKVAGAKMPRLSTSELRNLLIPIPPIDLQNRFKNIVSQMSALQTKFESSSIENESLFNALSQKAFSGKL